MVPSVPEAVYPEEELRKYHIDLPPSNSTPVGSQVVKVARRRKDGSRRKQKVQNAGSGAPSQIIRRHISESSWTVKNWYRHIHWKNFTVVVIVPLLGLLTWVATEPEPLRQTFLFALFDYVITVLSINILYHRYWCHHSFDIHNDYLIQLMSMVASGGGITCALNWCASHRAHHRHCDVTDRDPHSIRQGFIFSHVGWMILIFNPRVSESIKAGKLDEFSNNEAVQWEAQNYFSLFLSFGLIFPSVVCGWFWNDYIGGLVYAGFLKVFLVQQAMFLENSLGHTFGIRPFNSSKSPRDNVIVNFLSLGEGNQNFHQEFPMDYRNGSQWYSWDPTKWSIRILQGFGLISNLKKASQSSIDKSLVQEEQRQLDNMRSDLKWGIPIDRLPVFTPEQLKELAKNARGRYYVVVSGIIHDVTPFAKDHPGGLALMDAAHGKDATTAFNGAVYQHSNAARNLLATMRIGVLGGSEDLYWKQERMENKSVPLDSDSGGHKIVRSGSQATTSNNVIGGTADAA
ncbi:DEKNAAC100247 [Brettanomyces naardenensis]|uniref:Acyl-CoA desaturase n=1 Tax=Brettanomyces naardenensis TaxID=13370 RepID=A0A448YEE2_BRENA|nr:DEKNAAC100247 [Brettanomyces naardenensis]